MFYRRFCLRHFRICRIFLSAVLVRLAIGLMVFLSMKHLLRRETVCRNIARAISMSPKITMVYSRVKMKAVMFLVVRRNWSNNDAAFVSSSKICRSTFASTSDICEIADEAKSFVLSHRAEKYKNTFYQKYADSSIHIHTFYQDSYMYLK